MMISGSSEAPVKSNRCVDVSFTSMKKRLKFYSNTLKVKAYRCVSPWMLSLHKRKNVCVLISHGFIGFLVKLFLGVYFLVADLRKGAQGREDGVQLSCHICVILVSKVCL